MAENIRGAWKEAKFKKYNFDAEGAPPNAGAFHPLMKVREEFRNIFFEMGFVVRFHQAKAVKLRAATSPASPKCQPTSLSNQVSGASMPFLCRNNILPESCRILSTSKVCSDLCNL